MSQASLPPEVPVAEATEFVDLPGFLRKYVVIGNGEVGLVVHRGQIARTLSPGKQRVGWVLFGAGSDKSAVRITQEFSVRVSSRRLPTRDYKAVDAFMSARVKVTDPALFYRAFVRDKPRVDALEVGAALSPALDDFLQSRVLAMAGLALAEGKGAAEVTASLEPVVADFLKERGLALAGEPSLMFRAVVEEDKAFEELENMRARFTTETLVERTAQEDAVKALERQGLITTEELVNARLAIGTGSPLAPAMIAELMKRADQRQDADLAARGQALTEKVAAAAGTTPPAVAQPGRRRFLPFLPLIGALVAIGAYIAWATLMEAKVGAALKSSGGLGALLGVLILDSRILVRSYVFKVIFWLGAFFGGFFLGRKTAPKTVTASSASPAGTEAAPVPTRAAASPRPLATASYQGTPDFVFGFIVMAVMVGLAPAMLVWVVLRAGAQQPELGLVLGVVVGVIGTIFAALYEWSNLQAWRSKQDPGPKLDKWVERHSLQTDELVRGQIARDLSTYLNDIKEAKLEAHRKSQKETTTVLDRMEKEADLFRTEVEGAAYGRTVLTAKSKPARARVARLIQFEEDLSRQARLLALGAQEVREGVRKGADVASPAEGLTVTLQGLRRRFTQRQSFLEGFIQ